MSTQSVIVGAVVAVVAAVLIAIFLVGDSEGDGGGAVTDAGEIVTRSGGTSTSAGEPSKIKTTGFDASKAGGEEVAVPISATDTGVKVWGMVEDPNGRPLPDAKVDLVRDVSVIVNRAQEDEVPVGSAVTGPRGTFAFRNLELDDVYVLRVKHGDYTTKRVHPINPRRPSTTQSVVVRMQGGLSVSGLVQDTSGGPIGDATVYVYDLQVQTLDPEGQIEQVARTGPNGEYLVRNVNPGTKKVIVRKEGYAAEGRAAINVRSEQDGKGINVVLRAGFTITGVVLDSRTRQPIKDARVVARPVRALVNASEQNAVRDPKTGAYRPARDGARTDEETGRNKRRAPYRGNSMTAKSFLLQHARTDEQGRFVLGNLLSASYMLMVRAKGYQPNLATNRNAGSENVEIALAPSAAILGTAVDDETGEPVKAFAVAVTPNPAMEFIPAQSRQRFSDAEGRFNYLDVKPGKMHILIEAEGYAGGRAGPFDVLTGQKVEGVEVRLVRGATLKGRVVAKNGDPVKGARVGFTSMGGAMANPQAAIFMNFLKRQMRKSNRTVFTDKDGRWTLPNVFGGTYRIKVSHSKFTEGESAEFTCESSGVCDVPDIVLSAGGTIKGTIHTKDGKPDPKASVMVHGTDPNRPFNSSSNTDDKGRFEFRGLAAGSYKITVHMRDGQLQLFNILKNQQQGNQRIVQVNEGEVVTVDDL